MAYRIGKDVTFQQMFKDVYRFLRELTSISEVDYQSSHGNGALHELSVPAATSTTETWTLTCQDDTFPARFSVMGNVTGYTADAYVNQYYDNGIIQFTLKDGSEPWVVGDIVTFSTKTAVYTPWEPRDVNPKGDITKAPMYIKGFRQKQPQFGSDWFGTRRGSYYLIDGPKNNSWACRPTKKARWSDIWDTRGRTSSDVNYTAVGGPPMVDSIGRSDPDAPYDFTMQLWVKNIVSMRQQDDYDSGGEVVYPVVDKYSHGSTMGIQVQRGFIRVNMRYNGCCNSTNYLYYSWSHDFYIRDYLSACGKSLDDWFLITVAVNRTSNLIDVWIDKEYLGQYSHSNIHYTRPVIGGIGSFGDVADLVTWRGLLGQAEIDAIYDSPDAYDPWAPEIYDAFLWDEDTCLPSIDMWNRDNLGNPLTLQLYPNGYPYYSYRMDSIHNSSLMYHQTDPEIQQMNSYYYYKETHQWYNKGTAAYVYVLGEHPVNTVVDKYWLVATNEYLALVFKIFDQRTVQQLPVYQTLYVGRGDSLQDKLYVAAMGTRNTGNDYWYTGDANFKSGMYYQWTVVWYGQWLWQVPTRIGAPSKRGAYVEAGNSYNVWTVFHGQYYAYDTPSGRSSSARTWAWNSWPSYSDYGYWAPEYMGTFYGLYGIQAQDTTPEDIVIIDGIEHLAYTDCTQAGANSMLLLRLE